MQGKEQMQYKPEISSPLLILHRGYSKVTYFL